jgi:hypothetical protein
MLPRAPSCRVARRFDPAREQSKSNIGFTGITSSLLFKATASAPVIGVAIVFVDRFVGMVFFSLDAPWLPTSDAACTCSQGPEAANRQLGGAPLPRLAKPRSETTGPCSSLFTVFELCQNCATPFLSGVRELLFEREQLPQLLIRARPYRHTANRAL